MRDGAGRVIVSRATLRLPEMGYGCRATLTHDTCQTITTWSARVWPDARDLAPTAVGRDRFHSRRRPDPGQGPEWTLDLPKAGRPPGGQVAAGGLPTQSGSS